MLKLIINKNIGIEDLSITVNRNGSNISIQHQAKSPWQGEMHRKLFGGAIDILVPKDFLDVSQIRQVPDNQEVFVSKDSDATLIVELLETPEDLEDMKLGILFHWNELSQTNDSEDSQISFQSQIATEYYGDAASLCGIQNIPKFGKRDDVFKIETKLAFIRFGNINTDVIISFSAPEDNICISQEDFVSIVKSFKILDWTLFK